MTGKYIVRVLSIGVPIYAFMWAVAAKGTAKSTGHFAWRETWWAPLAIWGGVAALLGLVVALVWAWTEDK